MARERRLDRGIRRNDERTVVALLDDDVLAGNIAAEGHVLVTMDAHDSEFRMPTERVQPFERGSTVEAQAPVF
jgi:hypothetical protein